LPLLQPYEELLGEELLGEELLGKGLPSRHGKNSSELQPKLPSALLTLDQAVAKQYGISKVRVGKLMSHWSNRAHTVVTDSLHE